MIFQDPREPCHESGTEIPDLTGGFNGKKHLPSGYDCYIAVERSTIFKNGKPSISMGHLYHGYVTNNQAGCKSWIAQSITSRHVRVQSRVPNLEVPTIIVMEV